MCLLIIQALVEFLRSGYDPNILHLEGYYPIHTYISKRKKKYVDLLYVLLSQSEAKVDLRTQNGVPALHLAVEVSSVHRETTTAPSLVQRARGGHDGPGRPWQPLA